MVKSHIFFAFISILITISKANNPHQPNPPLISTLVTAWFPKNDRQNLPAGQQLEHFSKLLKTQVNLIIFGDKNLGALGKIRQNKNTKFVELDESVLTDSWYMKTASKLAKESSKQIEDKVNPSLAYSRMVLLKKAVDEDPFNTDQFIWINPNAFANKQISTIVQPDNIQSLLIAFRHHFFIITTPKNDQHVYQNIQKTYFQAKFDTFVSGDLFGGKKEAISTIYYIYEDLLRVVVQYDHNLWSEDALLSMLADRCPFLISYLTSDAIVTSDEVAAPAQPANRLLPQDTQKRFQYEKDELEKYEQLIGMTELGILFVGVLLCWQILKFLKYSKRQGQRDVHVEGASSEAVRLSSSNNQ